MNKWILILILALLGFLISFYINHKKKRGQKLVCFIGEECNQVIHSRYSATFSIPNEILGMIYYGLTAMAAILPLLELEIIKSIPFPLVFLIFSGGAALFSVRFLYIQIFVLKKFCEYCFTSALISLLILVLAII